jgi:DNA-binding NarL/FixJ family response regulator
MDVRMPVMDGVTATAALREERPQCLVLMLTTFDDEDYIVKALQAGARGYLLKDMPAGDLAQAIRLARAGLFQLDPGVAGKLVGALGRRGSVPAAPALPPVPLTARELAVLRLIARGATNREIADKLVISEGTVKNHISSILSRLGLRDRTEAAIYAHEHQLL